MYRLPPLVVSGSVALVVGVANVNILPAPGAGLQYRLVGGVLWVNRGATGITDLLVQDGLGVLATEARGLSLAGVPTVPLAIPEPGILIAPGQSLTIVTASSVAAGLGGGTLYYYLQAV